MWRAGAEGSLGLCAMPLELIQCTPHPHFLFHCHLCYVSSGRERPAVILLRAKRCWVPYLQGWPEAWPAGCLRRGHLGVTSFTLVTPA